LGIEPIGILIKFTKYILWFEEDMIYIWDEKKARVNFEKHGIRFEEAQVIWGDPKSLEYFEDFAEEERFIRVGLNPSRGILLVVFCERGKGDIVRIISARKATTSEKEIYEKELRS
jgi:uncharacterized DUF497 family protein